MLSGPFELSALLVWGYQLYSWLRFAAWQQVTLVDGLYQVGVVIPLPEYEWKGVERLVHGSILWVGELNLGLALFAMGLFLLPIEMLVVAQYHKINRKLGARRIKKRREELGYGD